MSSANFASSMAISWPSGPIIAPVSLSPSSLSLSVMSKVWSLNLASHFQVPVGFGLSAAQTRVEPAITKTIANTESRFITLPPIKRTDEKRPRPRGGGISASRLLCPWYDDYLPPASGPIRACVGGAMFDHYKRHRPPRLVGLTTRRGVADGQARPAGNRLAVTQDRAGGVKRRTTGIAVIFRWSGPRPGSFCELPRPPPRLPPPARPACRVPAPPRREERTLPSRRTPSAPMHYRRRSSWYR